MAAALQSVTPNTRSKPGSKEQQQQQQQTKGASKDDSKSLDGKDKAGPVKQPDRAQLDEAVAVLEKDVTALAAKLVRWTQLFPFLRFQSRQDIQLTLFFLVIFKL